MTQHTIFLVVQDNEATFRYSITQESFKDYVISKLRVLSVKDSDAGQLVCRAVNQKVSTFTAELEIEFVVGKFSISSENEMRNH